MPTEAGSSFTGLPKRFGRYEVVRELGKGAMGVVYLGKDPVIGRLVALKTIRAAAEDDLEQREFSERFLREAQAAGTLNHPNIVTVHDVGEEDETSFIAMEYVEGKNLKQLIREKEPLSWDRISEIIAHAAEALDYAHRRGIVHRDVKPANIIITPDGAVKITDFGIAKIETSSLTETGQFLGTPNYMSPEQVTGEVVDGRSDLFSLGVVLYELLTKKKPFLGDNVTSISYKIVHEDYARLQAVDTSIPAEFNPILAQALAKDPASRYQRGSDFARALSEYKARQAEYEMIRGLGEMVAQAERLGPVATVEAPPSAAPRGGAPVPEETVKAPPKGPGTGPPALASLTRQRRDDLNPQLAVSTPKADLDSSIPDWSLDTDAMRKPAARDPVPPSPGTMISDPGAAKAETAPAPAAASPAPPPAASAPAPGLRPDEKTPPRPVPAVRAEPPATPRPVPALDFGGSVKTNDVSGPIRRPAPAPKPEGGLPGPRPPALPQEVTGPVPRVAGPPTASQPVRPAPRPAAPAPIGAASTVARERTAPVRIEAAPAAAAEPEEKATFSGVLRRDVNRRWVLIILGIAVGLGLLIAGLMWQRSRSIAPSKNPAESAAFEETVATSRRLLDDGNRFLAEGKLEEARKSFADLVRRAPDSAPARDALRQTQLLIAKKAELDRRNEQVARHLEAARAARETSRWPAAASEAAAARALEPENEEAKGIEALALESIRKLPKGARSRAEAELRALKAAPAAAVAPATAGRLPAADLPLSVSFRSPVPEGWLFVRFDDREVFRRAFEFGPGASGGLVEGNADLPPGSGELRVWVIAADGSVRDYATRKVERTGNEKRTLVVELDAARKLSLAVK